jgi:hypothetical protein
MHDVGASFSQHGSGIPKNIPNPEAMGNLPRPFLVGIDYTDYLNARLAADGGNMHS